MVPMLENYVKKILASRVYDLAQETPLVAARLLSKRYNTNISLKREDLQPVFSFKIRGSYNKMAQMTEAERDAAMKKCFDTFKNYPQQRDRCLNHARTAEIIAEDEN